MQQATQELHRFKTNDLYPANEFNALKRKLSGFFSVLGFLLLMTSTAIAQTPVSNFNLASPTVCVNQTVQVTDNSSNSPTSWSYSVNGIFSSSSQNPVLTFPTAGTYTLSLVATNGSGAGTLASLTVTAVSGVPLFVAANTGTLCSGKVYSVSASGASNYYLAGESNSLTGTSFTVSPPVTTTYTIYGIGPNGCPSPNGSTFTVTVFQTPTLVVNSGSICAGSAFTFTPTGGTTYTYTSGSATVSPVLTTQYSVSTTSANGCTAQVVSTVVVQSSSLAVAGTTAICNGSAVTLTASGATSYTWNNNATTAIISASPTSNTSYSVTGLAANGCTSSVTMSISVTQMPTVAVSGNTIICNGQATSLTGSGAASYSWSSGALTPVVALNPTITSGYTLTGTSGPCTNTIAVAISVNPVPVITVSGVTTICEGLSTNLTANGANSYNWSTGAITQLASLSPTVTTNYTVSGSIANCSNSIQVTVSVNPAPSLTVNSGSICAGKTFIILPGGGLNYTYSGNSPTVMPLVSTNYTVTGSGANGCYASVVSGVTVNPLPNVTISPSVSSICINQTAVLTAGGAGTYTWNTGSNNFAIIVAPSSTTDYTLTGTDLNGCINTATASLKVIVCNGLAEQTGHDTKISVYPNPAKDAVMISTNLLQENIHIEIYNSIGELVLQENLEGSQSEINISCFAQGVYFVRLKENNRVLAQSKIIKE